LLCAIWVEITAGVPISFSTGVFHRFDIHTEHNKYTTPYMLVSSRSPFSHMRFLPLSNLHVRRGGLLPVQFALPFLFPSTPAPSTSIPHLLAPLLLRTLQPPPPTQPRRVHSPANPRADRANTVRFPAVTPPPPRRGVQWPSGLSRFASDSTRDHPGAAPSANSLGISTRDSGFGEPLCSIGFVHGDKIHPTSSASGLRRADPGA
jgi:hypothetical protein